MISAFIQEKNIKMLWDVISDEDIFRFLTPDIQSKINGLFINNIQGFYESERMKSANLVEMNKKYVLLILNHIKKTYPYQPSKIKIYNQPTESITYEEIQNDRRNKFDTDLNKRQQEFDDIMNIKTPPLPEFSDGCSDTPIKDMDRMLKEIQTQRNYDSEQINNLYSNSNNNSSEWLKPQKTSLKNDKLSPDLDASSPKKVSWENEPAKHSHLDKLINNGDELFDNVDDEDFNLFSRLKPKQENINIQMNEDTNRISNLERSVEMLNNKIDRILELLKGSH